MITRSDLSESSSPSYHFSINSTLFALVQNSSINLMIVEIHLMIFRLMIQYVGRMLKWIWQILPTYVIKIVIFASPYCNWNNTEIVKKSWINQKVAKFILIKWVQSVFKVVMTEKCFCCYNCSFIQYIDSCKGKTQQFCHSYIFWIHFSEFQFC